MGNSKSKINKDEKLNKNNKIVKVKNISTDLKKNFSLKENIINVVDEIFNDDFNIIVLEGLNDKLAVFLFYKKFQEINKLNNNKFNIVPSIDEFDTTQSMSIIETASIELSWDSTSKKQAKYQKYSKVIISSFPINNYSIYDLYKTESKMIKSEDIIISNINVFNFVFSVFSCTLTPNLLYIDNSKIREEQLKEIENIIFTNAQSINNNTTKNFVLGEFSIYGIIDKDINDEYLNLIQDHSFIDLDSVKNLKIKKKTSYILLHLNDKKKYVNKKLSDINDLLLKNDNIYVLKSEEKELYNPQCDILMISLLIRI